MTRARISTVKIASNLPVKASKSLTVSVTGMLYSTLGSSIDLGFAWSPTQPARTAETMPSVARRSAYFMAAEPFFDHEEGRTDGDGPSLARGGWG